MRLHGRLAPVAGARSMVGLLWPGCQEILKFRYRMEWICCINGKGRAARRLRPAQAARPKIWCTKDRCAGMSSLGTARTWPLASIAIASMPASVRFAVQKHLVAWIRQESSRIRHLWRLTDSEVSSLFSGLAYPCNKVTWGASCDIQ